MNYTTLSSHFVLRPGWVGIAVMVLFLLSAAPAWAERGAAKGAAAPRPVTPRRELAADEKSTIALFERSRDAVVFITTTKRVMDLWSRNIFTLPRGTGSGFLWDDRGHVITNFHVIEGAAEAWVRLADGKEYRAALVGASPAHDLAVLRIGAGANRTLLPVGTSRDLKVGQKVLAIGNPFGLDWTLTTGIVSALDRSLKGETGLPIEHLIQTDAAINPGNSGGPLLDSAGRLIGVNTAIYSPSGASAGVGFAVPVDTVNRVVPQLIARGKYASPSLGIEIDQNLNDLLTSRLEVRGVLVLRVIPGSAAAAAGLKGALLDADGTFTPGDLITAIDGKPVDDVQQLLARLDDFQVGDPVSITLLRDGRVMERKVILQGE